MHPILGEHKAHDCRETVGRESVQAVLALHDVGPAGARLSALSLPVKQALSDKKKDIYEVMS